MYLTRKDLLDRGWELADIQKFSHDSIKKSETGRGRPSYLYLFSRIEQKEKGLQVDPTEIQINDAKQALTMLPKALLAPTLDVCNKPQEIAEPAPKPVAVIEPSKWLSVAPEIAPKAVKVDNPSAIKVDRNSLPKGQIRVILVDNNGNESLADLSQAA